MYLVFVFGGVGGGGIYDIRYTTYSMISLAWRHRPVRVYARVCWWLASTSTQYSFNPVKRAFASSLCQCAEAAVGFLVTSPHPALSSYLLCSRRLFSHSHQISNPIHTQSSTITSSLP